jgi:hypothetical protein
MATTAHVMRMIDTSLLWLMGNVFINCHYVIKCMQTELLLLLLLLLLLFNTSYSFWSTGHLWNAVSLHFLNLTGGRETASVVQWLDFLATDREAPSLFHGATRFPEK